MERTNIKPSHWGPPAWTFLYSVFYSYPVYASSHDKVWMTTFLNVLGEALPCAKCRENYNIFRRMFPVDDRHVAGQQQVLEWIGAYREWFEGRSRSNAAEAPGRDDVCRGGVCGT